MRYKIIKSLQPLELFDIFTRGFCDNHLPSIKKEFGSAIGEWYLTNWCNNIKIDLLTFYLSDSGFCLWTSKEEAEKLERIFKSWNIFYNVGTRWYGGSTYIIGLNWDDDGFNILYKEWLRNRKLNEILY